MIPRRPFMKCALACCSWIAVLVPCWASALSVIIRNEHGVVVPARVYLIDSSNNSIFPNHTIAYDKTSFDGIVEKSFVPPNGVFSIDLPDGAYRIVVERGKEYLPVDIRIHIRAPRNIKRTVVLHRWINMGARGWFSADMHVHRPLADLPTLMDAEDLSAAVPITQWSATWSGGKMNADPSLQHYLSIADADGIVHLKEGRFFPVLNEELESNSSAVLGTFLGRNGVQLAYPFSDFGRAVLARGGVADSEKATSLELPGLAAVGACQTVGLANNSLWRSGSYLTRWGAWPDRALGQYPQTCSGFVRAGFDIYAALLDMGFPLKPSAGSASGALPVPPGWSRIYVHTQAPLTPQLWVEALKQGRSFVTTGPMIFLRVNGKEPGDEVHLSQFPLRLHVSLEMFSLTPVSKAEIVLNGQPHDIALRLNLKDPHRYSGSTDLTAESSTWITARWSAARSNGCDVAHTSPIYFWDGTKPIPVNRDEAEKLLDRVNSLIDQVSKGGSGGDIVSDSEDIRNKTLKYLNQAQEVYLRILSKPSP